MPIAGQHWGMRNAMKTYYKQRTVYGHTRVYFGGRACLREVNVADTYTFDTVIPDTLQIGQPMGLDLRLFKSADNKSQDLKIVANGAVTKIGDHSITFQLFPGERAKVDEFRSECKKRVAKPDARPPVYAVDADRLIAWQLYWRGENFWSGGEIWAFLPEMRTAFVPANNAELNKYFSDRTRAIPGRRYFVITEGARITGFTSIAPTTRARDTYQVLDTSSNKFAIAAFWL
jgi:hypothetical protein